MPDDPAVRRPQDALRINVNEPYEVRYWMKEFGVTEAELRNAAKAVGVMTKNVATYLGKAWPNEPRTRGKPPA